MDYIEKASTSLTETIKDDNITEAIAEISEAILDIFFDDGLLKEIPIIGSIYRFSKAGLSISDRLFTKKLIRFLHNLDKIPQQTRKRAIERIENDPKYKTKVGEKLLFIIDRCEDTEKSEIIGKLFKFLLEGKLDYDDFLRASKCIELTHLEYLTSFTSDKFTYMDFSEAGDLVGSGLMKAVFVPGQLHNNGGSDGSINCIPSDIGKKIQELFKNNL
jgi:hypothetical protein